MFAKMLITAALLTSSVALASDVSYDQQQIRRGAVTSVEGALPAKVTKSESQDARPCACAHHHHHS